jgi:DNA-binding NarL/FixJ family response regulator
LFVFQRSLEVKVNSYRIFLADNQEMFRHGIRNIICQIDDLHIAGETGNGHELMALVEKELPDLVIMEVDLKGLNGLEVLRKLKKNCPQVKVLILTSNRQKEFIRKAIKREVDGLLLKEDPSHELTRAIEKIRDGKKFFSALLSCEMVSLLNLKKEHLSGREREVLQCLAEGMSNRKIAASLNISIYTLYRHRHNIKRKLEFKNQAELINYAVAQKNFW